MEFFKYQKLLIKYKKNKINCLKTKNLILSLLTCIFNNYSIRMGEYEIFGEDMFYSNDICQFSASKNRKNTI